MGKGPVSDFCLIGMVDPSGFGDLIEFFSKDRECQQRCPISVFGIGMVNDQPLDGSRQVSGVRVLHLGQAGSTS